MAKNSVNTLGATNHSRKERSLLDYYGTDPKNTRDLVERETFQHNIWEPGSGHNLIVNELREAGYEVRATDIHDYGCQNEILDFLESTEEWDGDIVMNPPYYDAEPFITKALSLVKPGAKVAGFLRLLFLESQGRYERLFKENPPKTIYVYSKRQVCSKADDFTEASSVAYCWIVWEKGFTGDPVIKWIY